jgi:hypothetical protein
MFFERIAVGERFVTHATDKRFLLGVYSKMFHQIASVSKCIATCWTMIIAIVPFGLSSVDNCDLYSEWLLTFC